MIEDILNLSQQYVLASEPRDYLVMGFAFLILLGVGYKGTKNKDRYIERKRLNGHYNHDNQKEKMY